MSGIEYYAKEYEVQQLQEQIWELQSQVRDLEAKLERIMTQPPIEPYSGGTTCAKCGMRWEGAMGYVCIQPGCPVQMQVTSQI
jgi:hypothetical protein